MSDVERQIDSDFAGVNDFTLCEILHGFLEDHYGFERIVWNDPPIPRERRVIHYIRSLTGFLEVNGFSYFWGVDIDHAFVAQAFDEIGDRHQAKNFRDALALITDSAVLGDYNMVNEFFGSSAIQEEIAEPFQQRLYAHDKDIQEKLAHYARRRRYMFADLYDELHKDFEKYRTFFEETRQ